MARGFSVSESIDQPVSAVWNYLTDFSRASQWMTGIDDFRQVSAGPLGAGTRLSFRSRGKERESVVSAFEPERRIALTSTQGGVTATYTYSLEPEGGGTRMTLDALCDATGWWKLVHPIIAVAMKMSDASHLANIKAALARS